MSERDYKAEVHEAQSAANADPRIAAAIIQAKAIDRLTHEIARLAHAQEDKPKLEKQIKVLTDELVQSHNREIKDGLSGK